MGADTSLSFPQQTSVTGENRRPMPWAKASQNDTNQLHNMNGSSTHQHDTLTFIFFFRQLETKLRYFIAFSPFFHPAFLPLRHVGRRATAAAARRRAAEGAAAGGAAAAAGWTTTGSFVVCAYSNWVFPWFSNVFQQLLYNFVHFFFPEVV